MRVRVCSTRSSKLRVAYLELRTTLRYLQRIVEKSASSARSTNQSEGVEWKSS